MLHFSNIITFVPIQLCIDVQTELNINNFSVGWVGEILFASVRIRNSAPNDKYLFAHAVSRSYNSLVKNEKQNITHPDTVCKKKSWIYNPTCATTLQPT